MKFIPFAHNTSRGLCGSSNLTLRLFLCDAPINGFLLGGGNLLPGVCKLFSQFISLRIKRGQVATRHLQ